MSNPTEEIQKHLHEQAEHTHEPSTMKIALSSALIAVLAAGAALLSEHQSNEAMLDQLKASDQWSYYQAKGIKSIVVQDEIATLKAMGKSADPKLDEQLKRYADEQKEISDKATELEQASLKHFSSHNVISYANTFLEIAIGVSAISALLRRRWLWHTSIIVAVLGLGFLSWGMHLMLLIK
jgi:hypothetical protein